MPAGSRRFKVQIQRPSQADDAGGQVQQSFVQYCKPRWAEVVATGGTERFRGRQIQAQMTHVITVISDSETRGITPGMQVIWRGRTINLEVVMPMEGKIREIQLQGKEYVKN